MQAICWKTDMSSSQCKSPKASLYQVSSETGECRQCVAFLFCASILHCRTGRGGGTVSVLPCIIGVYVSRKCETGLPKSQGSYTYSLTKNSCIWFNNLFFLLSLDSFLVEVTK